MTEGAPEPSEYIHGSSPEEQHRLSLLNDLLNNACLRELDLKPGERVLDLGCGTGQFTRLMARTVGGNAQVLGIERDADQLSQASSLAETAEQSALVEFRQGDALDLPLHPGEWGSFDFAHARFLLEHIPDPASVIAQMSRAVRPGGRIFLSDDDHDNFRPWPEPAGFTAIWKAYVQSFQILGNDPFVGRKLVALLKQAGLTNLRNASVFFGGCAGNERFEAIAENLIVAIEGAKETILSNALLDEVAFIAGMDGLRQWKTDPSAVLWYSVSCAEGTVPT